MMGEQNFALMYIKGSFSSNACLTDGKPNPNSVINTANIDAYAYVFPHIQCLMQVTEGYTALKSFDI